MTAYVVRRLAWVVVLLFLVSALTFLIFYSLPTADPAALRAGRQPNPELVEQIRRDLGLDKPWYQQFAIYMRDLVTDGDFGRSYQNNAEVRSLIFERLPATASLALGAVVIWVLAGVAVGVASAVRRGTWVDRLAMGAALLAISAPVYWLGLVALYLFSSDIGKVPIFPGSGSYTDFGEDPFQWLGSLILPWLVLAASFAAFYARLLRGSLTEAMGEDYIRTARAKGLPERRVVWRHGVRSAITPVVTALGLDIGVLLGGVILVERVFNIPGVGRLAFNAIERADLPVIQGTVLMGAFFIVLLVLVVDIAYAFIDPRVRYS